MNLKNRSMQHALDLFSGTGSVSLLLKRNLINTTSNDFLRFASFRTRSILLDKPPERNSSLETAMSHGFVTNNYSDFSSVNIFKQEIANHIDGARILLESQKSDMTQEQYVYYLSQIVEAADFRSNIMGSYESFYKRGWRKQCDAPWSLPDFEFIDNFGATEHKVYNNNWSEILNKDKIYDFIYLDPPYNSRQYSSVMHVLETINMYDNPEVSGKVRKSESCKKKKSNFSSVRECNSEFEKLITACSEKSREIFISYSNEGIASIEKIEDMLTRKYRKVKVYSEDYRRFKTNSSVSGQKRKVKEYLFHGIK